MDAPKRRKEAVVTDRVTRMKLRERGLQQIPQKRDRPLSHPLLQGFGRNVHRHVELRSFGRQLGYGGFGSTPATKGYQGEKQLARDLRGPLDKFGPPRAGFNLVGGKELC